MFLVAAQRYLLWSAARASNGDARAWPFQQTHSTIVDVKLAQPQFVRAASSRLRRKDVVMNANRELWEKGDFTRIADMMRESGEAVVRSLGITPSVRVLDLSCGDGTTAISLAHLGADVVGVNIASNLVEAGKRRASEAGLDRLQFRQGDACDLQEDDASFDLTLSMFGAMFAPKPHDVARQMVSLRKHLSALRKPHVWRAPSRRGRWAYAGDHLGRGARICQPNQTASERRCSDTPGDRNASRGSVSNGGSEH